MTSVLLISLFQSSDLLFNNITIFIVPSAGSFSFAWLRMIWRACWKRNGYFYRPSWIKHLWLDVVWWLGTMIYRLAFQSSITPCTGSIPGGIIFSWVHWHNSTRHTVKCVRPWHPPPCCKMGQNSSCMAGYH